MDGKKILEEFDRAMRHLLGSPRDDRPVGMSPGIRLATAGTTDDVRPEPDPRCRYCGSVLVDEPSGCYSCGARQ